MSTMMLKGQSLYCLTRYTEIISIRYKDMFPELVISCSYSVADIYPTAIRVAGCKSLTIFFRKIEKHKLKLTEEQVQFFHRSKVAESILTIELTSQTNNYVLEALIELVKCLGANVVPVSILPFYLLENLHKNIMNENLIKICFNLLQILCSDTEAYQNIILAKGDNDSEIIIHSIIDCLQTYINIIKSNQKNYLKPMDINLISTVLKLSNIIITKCPQKSLEVQKKLSTLTPLLTEIIKFNENLQIQVLATICLKNLIRLCPQEIKQSKYV